MEYWYFKCLLCVVTVIAIYWFVKSEWKEHKMRFQSLKTDAQNIGKLYIPYITDNSDWNTTLSLYSQIEKLSIGYNVLNQVRTCVKANYLEFDNTVSIEYPLNFDGSSNNPKITIAEIFNVIFDKQLFMDFTATRNLLLLNEQLNRLLKTIVEINQFPIENTTQAVQNEKMFKLVSDTIKVIHQVFSNKKIDFNLPVNHKDDLFVKENQTIEKVKRLVSQLSLVFPQFETLLNNPMNWNNVVKLHNSLMSIEDEIMGLNDIKAKYNDFQMIDVSLMKDAITTVRAINKLQLAIHQKLGDGLIMKHCDAKTIDDLRRYQRDLEKEIVNCVVQ